MLNEAQLLLRDLSAVKVNTASFPSHFGVTIELRDAIADERVTLKNVADIVSRDPIVASKVVATANSALMGGAEKITSVERAVSRVGFETVKRIMIAVTMLQLARSKDMFAFNGLSRKIWLNTIYCAAASSVLAKNHSSVDPAEMFFAGLVLNIGAFFVIHQASMHKVLRNAVPEVTDAVLEQYLPRSLEILHFLHIPDKVIDAIDIRNHYPNPKAKAFNKRDMLVFANDMAAMQYPWSDKRVMVIDDFTVFSDDVPDIEQEFNWTRSSFQD